MFGKRRGRRPDQAGRPRRRPARRAAAAARPRRVEPADRPRRPLRRQAAAPRQRHVGRRSPGRRPRRAKGRASGGPKLTAGFEQLRAAQGSRRPRSSVSRATTTTRPRPRSSTPCSTPSTWPSSPSSTRRRRREEIRDIVAELVAIKNVSMSVAEQEHLVQDIINDVLGYGPLEPLLARDDIADIMVNGASRVFIEVGGKVQLTNVRFRDNAAADEHLPADRQPGRPPRRRKLADLRRAPAGRQPGQRHRAARWRWTGRP